MDDLKLLTVREVKKPYNEVKIPFSKIQSRRKYKHKSSLGQARFGRRSKQASKDLEKVLRGRARLERKQEAKKMEIDKQNKLRETEQQELQVREAQRKHELEEFRLKEETKLKSWLKKVKEDKERTAMESAVKNEFKSKKLKHQLKDRKQELQQQFKEMSFKNKRKSKHVAKSKAKKKSSKKKENNRNNAKTTKMPLNKVYKASKSRVIKSKLERGIYAFEMPTQSKRVISEQEIEELARQIVDENKVKTKTELDSIEEWYRTKMTEFKTD